MTNECSQFTSQSINQSIIEQSIDKSMDRYCDKIIELIDGRVTFDIWARSRCCRCWSTQFRISRLLPTEIPISTSLNNVNPFSQRCLIDDVHGFVSALTLCSSSGTRYKHKLDCIPYYRYIQSPDWYSTEYTLYMFTMAASHMWALWGLTVKRYPEINVRVVFL